MQCVVHTSASSGRQRGPISGSFVPPRRSAQQRWDLFVLVWPWVRNSADRLENNAVHIFYFVAIPEYPACTPIEDWEDAHVSHARLLDTEAF